MTFGTTKNVCYVRCVGLDLKNENCEQAPERLVMSTAEDINIRVQKQVRVCDMEVKCLSCILAGNAMGERVSYCEI